MLFKDLKPGEYFQLFYDSTTVYKVVSHQDGSITGFIEDRNLIAPISWKDSVIQCDKDGKELFPRLRDLVPGDRFKFINGMDYDIRKVMSFKSIFSNMYKETLCYIVEDINSNKIYEITDPQKDWTVERVI